MTNTTVNPTSAAITFSGGQPGLGVPILQNVTSGVRAAVEIAWGADLTDLTAASWTWTDVSHDVQFNNGHGIDIQMGRPDESSQTQTAVLTVQFDNTSGKYSQGGQNTVNYPYVRRGTPARVRISTDGGVTWAVQFQGNAVGFSPNWDTTGNYATVTLTASGPLRRFNQGSLTAQSALSHAVSTGLIDNSKIIGYWPCEDGLTSITAASWSGRPGNSSFAKTNDMDGLPTTGSGSGLPALGTFTQFVGVPSGMTIPGEVNTKTTMGSYTNTGNYQIDVLLGGLTPNGSGNWNSYIVMHFSSGPEISIMQFNSGTVDLCVSTNVNYSGMPLTAHLNNDYAAPTHLIYTLSQSGGTINVSIHARTINNGAIGPWANTTGTISGTLGTLQKIYFQLSNWQFDSGVTAASFGHYMIRNTIDANPETGAYAQAAAGYAGESVVTRFTRVCAANGIPITILDDAGNPETSANNADTMGPQYFDAVGDVLREAETTGFGVLYDGLNNGLTYVTRLLREGQQPKMTLDATSGIVVMPFAPIDDDQLTYNDVTVTQRNAFSSQYIDTTSLSSANLIGDYQNSITVNQNSPATTDLSYSAQWMVAQNTQTAYRYPTWSFELEKVPSQIPNWIACYPACRFDVTNISSVRSQHPVGAVANVLEGWHEFITQLTWHVDANATTYEAWRVITLAAATGSTSDTVGRYESDGSTVTSNVSAGGTSISVTTPSGPIWTQSSVTADDFPLTVSINGNPITVTAISGATSPQTFTVSAVPYAIAAGSAVTIWRNAILAM